MDEKRVWNGEEEEGWGVGDRGELDARAPRWVRFFGGGTGRGRETRDRDVQRQEQDDGVYGKMRV